MNSYLSPGDIDFLTVFVLLLLMGVGVIGLSRNDVFGLLWVVTGGIGLDIFIGLNVYYNWKLEKTMEEIKENKK